MTELGVDVVDVPDSNRYEARVDGRLAGFADYIRTAELVVFTHTEVDTAFEGHGVGGALARFGMDHARALGLKVMPQCPFVKRWLGRHREYADLIYS